MYSIGLSMQLKPGSYEGYKEAHDNLWPEIAKSMDDNSVSMSIYRLGDRLFLHAVAPSEADWLKSREASCIRAVVRVYGKLPRNG